MRVNVYVKMRHAMYASSWVEEVRVIESGSVDALNLELDDDWREFPAIEWQEFPAIEVEGVEGVVDIGRAYH